MRMKKEMNIRSSTHHHHPSSPFSSRALLLYYLASLMISIHTSSSFIISVNRGVPMMNYQKDRRLDASTNYEDSPYLAVLTEPDACNSIKRMEATLAAIERATRDGDVDLVVVRTLDDSNGRNVHKLELLKRLSLLKTDRQKDGLVFKLVINNDVDMAINALSNDISIDGVHVKEKNIESIPLIRQHLQENANHNNITVGTSCHSIESALNSYQHVDYLFVGTCYMTESHPEKSENELEGPKFPGRVKEEIKRACIGSGFNMPIVIAVGGINDMNCREPVLFGADGVAVIRSIMQADDPGAMAKLIKMKMSDVIVS